MVVLILGDCSGFDFACLLVSLWYLFCLYLFVVGFDLCVCYCLVYLTCWCYVVYG